jgi:hypothetical protein
VDPHAAYHWCAEAIRRDGLLTDHDALTKFKARYGKDRQMQQEAALNMILPKGGGHL